MAVFSPQQNVVLLEPEIPNNTGNIGRLCLATNATLHLIKPFGFELSDSKLKRAGLDYWPHLDVKIYNNASSFFLEHANQSMVFFSSHGEQDYTKLPFNENPFLIFGKESVGLPKDVLEQHKKRVFKIPLFNDKIRSLNLANAVAIVLYEGIRQGFKT